MNLIWPDRVTAQILTWLNCVSFIFQSDLMRRHNLVNSSSDIAKSNIDSSLFDSLVRSLLHSQKKIVIIGVESYSKCAIDNMPVHLSSKIYLHNVVFSQNCVISRVRGVMGCAVVDTAACREPDTLKKPILLNQSAIGFLDHIA